MSRPAPRYPTGEIVARCVLDPNGAHRLEVETTGGIMIACYGTEALPSLEQAIAQFKRICARADGGPDFHHRKVIGLEVS